MTPIFVGRQKVQRNDLRATGTVKMTSIVSVTLGRRALSDGGQKLCLLAN